MTDVNAKQEPKAAAPAVTVTASDLKEILTSVITEARKPVVTDADRKRIADELQTRIEGGETVKQLMANRKATQTACLHKRRDGSTTMVYVRGSGLEADASNYLICQRCQKLLFSHNEPVLFNEHFQLAGMGDIVQ